MTTAAALLFSHSSLIRVAASDFPFLASVIEENASIVFQGWPWWITTLVAVTNATVIEPANAYCHTKQPKKKKDHTPQTAQLLLLLSFFITLLFHTTPLSISSFIHPPPPASLPPTSKTKSNNMGCCYCTREEEDPEVQEVHETLKRSKSEFKGPLKEGRRIRDVFFLLLFIAFCGGLAVIAWRCFHTGDPLRIIYGTDSFGNICGVDNTGLEVKNATGHPNVGLDMTDYPYLYFRDPLAVDSSLAICISACPRVNSSDSGVVSCQSDNTPCIDAEVCFSTGPYDESVIPDGASVCPDNVYSSSNTLGLRRCVPGLDSFRNSFLDIVNSYKLVEQVFSDLIAGYEMFGYAAAVAVVVCFLVIFLMRFAPCAQCCVGGVCIFGPDPKSSSAQVTNSFYLLAHLVCMCSCVCVCVFCFRHQVLRAHPGVHTAGPGPARLACSVCCDIHGVERPQG